MDTFAELISAAHDGAAGINGLKPPTAEQARSGNYKKGRLTLHGLPIAIETPAGQRRTGKSDGQPWSVICMAHYGEFSGTKGADGDPIDVFIGPWPESERAYIVNRVGKAGQFDEHKCLIGFTDATSAINAYKNSYERGESGLSSFVPCSIDQLKWWIKFGDHSKPVTAKSLPHDGSVDMNELAWDSDANPVGTDLPGVLYQLRREDTGEGLLLDSVAAIDILEASEGEIALDALVIPLNRLERKMAQMQLAMKVAGDTVKPSAMQVTPPFKQRGTTNVAVIYELSDGQTVSVYFHNPDSTPNKLTPDDEMVSWKWLLNKKDVTLVVAPENGRDLSPREVARRIMRIAERNSARFQAANQKRAERMASIETLRAGVSEQEAMLKSLDAEIADLEVRVAEKKAATVAPSAPDPSGAAAPVAVAAATLQGETLNEHGEPVAGVNIEADQGQAVSRGAPDERLRVASQVVSELSQHGWGREDGPSIASKQYNTLSGVPVYAWLSAGDGYNFTLSGNFESEGRNVLSASSVLIPVGASDDEIANLVASFSGAVDLKVRESLGYQAANAEADQGQAVGEPQPASKSFDGRSGDVMEELAKLGWNARKGVLTASKKIDGSVYGIRANHTIDSSKNAYTALNWVDSGGGDMNISDDLSLSAELMAKLIDKTMIENINRAKADVYGPTSVEGYAIVSKSEDLQIRHQDELDSFFQERLVAVRNAMRELDWFGPEKVMTKGDYRFTFDVATVGAGSNVVGVKYQVFDQDDVEVFGIFDDLSRTPAEIAAKLNQLTPTRPSEASEPVKLSGEAADLLRSSLPVDHMDYGAAQKAADLLEAGNASELQRLLVSIDTAARDHILAYVDPRERHLVGFNPLRMAAAIEDFERLLAGSSDADPDAEVVAAAVEAAKRGAGGITRIKTSQYFTFEFEGDDLILSDELREKVEAALGAKLVEKVFPGFEGEVALVPEAMSSTQGSLIATAAGEDPALAEAKDFLQSVIDGAADLLDPSIADRLSAVFERYQGDPELMESFNKAAEAYSTFMVDQTRKVLGA